MLSPSQKKTSGSAAAIARKTGCSASSWWRAQEPKASRNGAVPAGAVCVAKGNSR
ncbi:hypothetical protein D3C83_319430 [compost metagenome]